MDDTRILLAMVVYNEKEKQPMIVIYQFWAADSPESDAINYYSLQLDGGIKKLLLLLLHLRVFIDFFFLKNIYR
jgi:hypothetical protein